MAGTVSVVLDLTQLPTGNVKSTTSQAPSSSNDYAITPVQLASGPNTVPVPAWAAGVIIRPDPTNVVALTLKGVTGDTGTPIAPGKVTGPIMFPASPPANIVLTAASNTATQTLVEFI